MIILLQIYGKQTCCQHCRLQTSYERVRLYYLSSSTKMVFEKICTEEKLESLTQILYLYSKQQRTMILRWLKYGVSAHRIFNKTPVYYTQILAINYNANTTHKRHYKNFGHKPEKEPPLSKRWYSLLIVLAILPFIDYKWQVKQFYSIQIFNIARPLLG